MIPRYQVYLHSPTWAVRRADALERAGYVCEECGTPYGLGVSSEDARPGLIARSLAKGKGAPLGPDLASASGEAVLDYPKSGAPSTT